MTSGGGGSIFRFRRHGCPSASKGGGHRNPWVLEPVTENAQRSARCVCGGKGVCRSKGVSPAPVLMCIDTGISIVLWCTSVLQTCFYIYFCKSDYGNCFLSVIFVHISPWHWLSVFLNECAICLCHLWSACSWILFIFHIRAHFKLAVVFLLSCRSSLLVLAVDYSPFTCVQNVFFKTESSFFNLSWCLLMSRYIKIWIQSN